MLNPINQGSNQFCGPAVISSITGISTDEAEKLIQKLRNNNNPVVGTWPQEIHIVLSSLGWRVTQVPAQGRSIFMMMMVLSKPGTYLFYVHKHVVAIEIEPEGKRFIIDNHTKSPLNLGNSSRLGQKVKMIVQLEKK